MTDAPAPRHVRTPRAAAALLVAAVVLSACTAEPEQDALPVASAVPVEVPAEAAAPAPESAEPQQTSAPSPPPQPAQEEDPDAVPDDDPTAPSTPEDADATGPTPADAARFVAETEMEGVTGLEHVVQDLDGDDTEEIVLTGIREDQGVVALAWWNGVAFAVLAEDTAGPGNAIVGLQVTDVNEDGLTEILVTVSGGALSSIAVWSVVRRGKLDRLKASGGCHAGSHVYGVIGARLEQDADGPPVIVATCDDSPLPQADWSEQRYRWDGRRYRVVDEPAPGPSPSPADPPSPGQGNEESA